MKFSAVVRCIPNTLTMIRFVGVIVATWYLFQKTDAGTYTAFFLYAGIGLSDFLDGYLARRLNAVTAFGKLMDPIADKAYVLTLYASFVFLGTISHWWLWPIFIREISVTVSRLLLVRQGKVVAAEKSGKIKTAVQNVSLLLLAIYYVNVSFWHYKHVGWISVLPVVMYLFLSAAVLLTITSGIDYYTKNKEAIWS